MRGSAPDAAHARNPASVIGPLSRSLTSVPLRRPAGAPPSKGGRRNSDAAMQQNVGFARPADFFRLPQGFHADSLQMGMGTIDDLLIEKIYSPLTGWLQHRLGVGQWRASIESLNGSTVFYIAGVAIELAAARPYEGISTTLLRALAWLLILDFVRKVAYRQAASSVGIRTARVREWLFRTILVAVRPLSLYYAQPGQSVLFGSLSADLPPLFQATDAPPPEPRSPAGVQPPLTRSWRDIGPIPRRNEEPFHP